MLFFQIKHYCPDPKCGNYVDFAVTQISEVQKREPDPAEPAQWRVVPKVQRPGSQKMPAENLDSVECCGLSRCPVCREPLLIVFRTLRHFLQQVYQATKNPQVAPHVRLLADDKLIVVRTAPESRKPIADKTWPEEIREPFVDVQKMLSENKTPSFIIGGCRAVLDVATRKLGAEKDALYDRINELSDQGVITGGLKDWAHKLRLDGNAALHELKGDRAEATSLVEFIRVFLHVAFELPERIREKAPPEDKEESKPADAQASAPNVPDDRTHGGPQGGAEDRSAQGYPGRQQSQ